MAHITGLSLGNFKVFKETTHFEFAPITILTGGNNVGKSSVLKALLLIADNAKKTQFLELDFSGEKHNLDTFDYTINKRADDDVIEMGFDIINLQKIKLSTASYGHFFLNFLENDCLNFSFSYYQSKKNNPLKNVLIKNNNITILEISFSEKNIDWFGRNQNLTLDYINFDWFIEQKIIEETRLKWIKEDFFSEDIEEGNKIITHLLAGRIEEAAFDIAFNTLKEENHFKTILETKTEVNFFDNELIKNIKDLFEDIGIAILEAISKEIILSHIGSFRANSKRLYGNHHQGTEFNNLLLEIHKTKFSDKSKPFIQSWLKKFGIGEDIQFTWFKGVATEVKIKKNNELIDLVDLGFGFTQLIPIILEIALLHEKSEENFEEKKHIQNTEKEKRNELFDYQVVLLEEPETNLHPNFQSKLADFLLDASKRFNIQFIIETHSEYLIRRLQYLVATKETYPKDIALYYFNDPENVPQGEEQVKKIEFLENGKLSDHFGMGFFDEANNLATDLFKLNRKKHRAEV